jgi:putative MFS transporter
MLVAAVLTAIGFFVCLFMAEETKGMTLTRAGGEPEAAGTNEEPALQAN